MSDTPPPGGDSAELEDAHYAVLVGIDHYESLRSLNGPSKDVVAFREWLVSPTGGRLPPANVRQVKATTTPDGSSDLEPTLAAIQRVIAKVNAEIRERIKTDPKTFGRSRLYIYVAGHGLSAPGTSVALISADAGPGMWGQALSLQACSQWYTDHGPFAEVVLLADCCRSRFKDVGVAGLPFDLWRDSRPSVPRIVLGFATLPDELAWEEGATDQDDARGYFSRALIESLQSDVDPDRGFVTDARLDHGVRARVAELTKPPPPPLQQYCYVVPAHPPMTFGPYRDSRRTVRIAVPAESAAQYGVLHIEDNDGTTVATCPPAAVGGTWELPLPARLYRLVWRDSDGNRTHTDPPIDVSAIGEP